MRSPELLRLHQWIHKLEHQERLKRLLVILLQCQVPRALGER